LTAFGVRFYAACGSCSHIKIGRKEMGDAVAGGAMIVAAGVLHAVG
jgi:hypothetical protein